MEIKSEPQYAEEDIIIFDVMFTGQVSSQTLKAGDHVEELDDRIVFHFPNNRETVTFYKTLMVGTREKHARIRTSQKPLPPTASIPASAPPRPA